MGRVLVGTIRVEVICCGITCDTGAATTRDTGTGMIGGGGTAVGFDDKHSNTKQAISANTPKGTAIPTAMATACELWVLGRHC
jgi:hypothetical protein